jgi:hypothetical protein
MRVLHSKTTPKAIVSFIKQKVDYILNHKWVMGKERDNLHDLYMIDICKAITALDPETICKYLTGQKKPGASDLWSSRDLKPSLAAAVEDLDMLRGSLLLPDLLPHHCQMFLNALEASIAANQAQALQFILSYLVTNVRGKNEAGSWDEMRNATRVITDAARVAVRLHKTGAVGELLKFLASNRVFGQSTGLYFEENLVKDCMRYGRADMLYSALVYDRKTIYDAADHDNLADFKLSEDEEKFLYRSGHPFALRGLIKRGLINLNRCRNGNSPIFHALDHRNYKLFRELLAHGAEVDGVINAKSDETALSYAAGMGHTTDVKILLEYGANPVGPGKKGTPLSRAQGHKKCEFLLEKVHHKGKSFLDRDNLWDIYEDENRRDNDWW